MSPNDFEKQLDKLAKQMPELFEGLLKGAGEAIKTEIQFRFDKEIAPSGEKWKKLSPLTIERRRKGPRKDRPDLILRDTGNMYKSLNWQVDIANKQVNIGFADPKALKHQFGGIGFINGRRIYIPARPMLDLKSESKDENDTINEAIERFSLAFNKIVE